MIRLGMNLRAWAFDLAARFFERFLIALLILVGAMASGVWAMATVACGIPVVVVGLAVMTFVAGRRT